MSGSRPSTSAFDSRSRRAAPTCVRVLVCLVLALAACGPERPAGRYAVVERGLDWRSETDAPPAPLTLHWQHAEDWSASPGTQQAASPDGLVLTATGNAGLVGPAAGGVEPTLHHQLLVRARTNGVTSLRVRWRGDDETFDDTRSLVREPGPVDEDGFSLTAFPLRSMRGGMGAAGGARSPGRHVPFAKSRDAADGVAAFELRFEADADGSPVSVVCASLTLASDFDAPDVDEGAAPPAHRLDHRGLLRDGVALRAPGRLVADLTPGRWDRLRLAFLGAGHDEPLQVRVRDAEGRMPEEIVLLAPGDAWVELAVDLSPLQGDAARLQVEALTEEAGAVVLVAEPLRLAPAADDPPDVVMYLVDTLRADRLATYGYERDTDPHLQQIAAEGVVFDSLVAASNWTRPATTSLLTSLDPLRHGNLTHLDRIGDGVTTLAEQLADAGYVTASFVTNYNAGAWSGLDRGFDTAREPNAHGAAYVGTSLTSAVLEEPVARFLAQHADERVFVYVHSMDPHQPYRPPMDDLYPLLRVSGESGAPSDALAYEGEIRHNDRLIASLDATLAEQGRRDNTLFVLTSDHGEAFGEHGTYAHRSSLHQEQLLVPWVLRWPAGLAGGRRLGARVTHVDVAPTVLGLLGVSAPDDWQGRDLSPELLADAPAAATTGEAAHFVHTTYSPPEQGFTEHVATLREGYKLIAGVGPDDEIVPLHFYLLREDPTESTDLVADPAHAQALTALIAWTRDRVQTSRAASTGAAAETMDPAQRAWMEEMGYLR